MVENVFVKFVIILMTFSVFNSYDTALCDVKNIEGISKTELDKRISHAWEFSLIQLKKAVETVKDSTKFPCSSNDAGDWELRDLYDWRSGFFPGCLWYAYEKSGDQFLKDSAIKWTESLEPLKEYTGIHDTGFMVFCSYGNGYRLTKNDSYRKIIIETANSLATRYNEKVGMIQSWPAHRNWTCPVIIDNMMNLELLFWASKNGGDKRLYDIAESHALRTMKTHVRQDGSTFHVVDFNPDTGELKFQGTAQGYKDNTTWARGLSWAVYGFTMSYRETKNPEFLKTAIKTANYFIDNLPDDYIPYWDFNAPNIPNESKDSSAAATAASGLLELSTLVKDKKLKEKYYNAAENILYSLCSPEYLTEGTNNPSIIHQAIGAQSYKIEKEKSLIHGEYYFLEALLRYKNMNK